MVEKILILFPDLDSTFVTTLLDQCKEEILLLTRRNEWTTDLDPIAIRMFGEVKNKLESAGISEIRALDITEKYFADYSPTLLRMMDRKTLRR